MTNRIVAAKLTMVSALKAGRHSRDQLARLSRLSKRTVSEWIAEKREFIHVADYAEDARGRKFVELFAWGRKPDAPRPGQRRTTAQRMADLRARRRKEKEGTK